MGMRGDQFFRDFETGQAARASSYGFDILTALEVVQRSGGDIISQTIDVFE